VESQDRVEARLCPRFKLDANLKIRSRTAGQLSGYALDISESGISAMLHIEVSMGEVVELDFELPLGRVNVRAIVRDKECLSLWIPVCAAQSRASANSARLRLPPPLRLVNIGVRARVA
jgi:PilZ domain